jgi:hypothetical protein
MQLLTFLVVPQEPFFTHYRLYKHQLKIPFAYELEFRVSGMSSARTYEFATVEPYVHTKTTMWNGNWSISFMDLSDEPRVAETSTQND